MPSMFARTRLVACPSCGCHARLSEAICPNCDNALRSSDGTIAPTKVALFLGIASLVAPAMTTMSCSDGDTDSGAGGSSADTVVGAGGASATSTVTSTVMTTSTISAYATGPTTTSSGVVTCDECGDANGGCIACAIEGNCADEYAACGADPGCIEFSNCFAACSDQACIDQCTADQPTGAELYTAFLVCVLCEECFVACDGSGC